MEKKLRATLEKGFDKLLKETLPSTYFRMMKARFLISVKSKKDFLHGVIVGDMLEGLGFCTYGAYKRYPKEEEFKELFKIIKGSHYERSIDSINFSYLITYKPAKSSQIFISDDHVNKRISGANKICA